jgi:hypothetical protein
MTYKKFIELYSKAEPSKKAQFVKKHIVREYLPYQNKIAEARKIVESSCYETIQDKKVYKQNSTLTYMLFALRVLGNYTDISWDNEKKSVDIFNEFTRTGALEDIISAISPKEYESFLSVLQMTRDDEYENYRSLAGFLETKFDAMSIMFEELANLIEQNKEK